MPISEYCESRVVTIDPGETIVAAAKRMRQEHIGCLVVVEEKRPVGIITDRDIVKRVVASGKDPDQTSVADIMTHALVTLNENVEVFTVISTMSDEGVRRVPIVDQQGQLVGIIAFDDLLLLLGSELVNLASISATERYRERDRLSGRE